MSEEIKDTEQKEHVSENPIINTDTERDSSSEVNNDKEIITPPEETKLEDNSITPHEKSTEKVDIRDLTKENLKKYEEDAPIDMRIDMSTIVMDKHGIPELTQEDIYRIRSTGIAFDGFENDIHQTRESIKEYREYLTDEYNNRQEKEDKEYIEKHKKELDKETDEEKRKVLERKIKTYSDAIANLPKYNEKTKLDIENRIKSGIRHLATYQNISRKDINKLQEDGTIASLISSTANGIFVQAFTESERKAKQLEDIEEDSEIKADKEELNKIQRDYDIGYSIEKGIRDIETSDLEFICNHARELKDPNKKYPEEITKNINVTDLSNASRMLRDIANFGIYGDQNKAVSEKYEDLKSSLITIEDNEFQELKDMKALNSKYIDKLEDYQSGTLVINRLYPIFTGDSNRLPEDDADKINPDEVKSKLAAIKEIFEKKWEPIKDKYEEIDYKIDEKRSELVKPSKDYITKFGLFNSFIGYSIYNSLYRPYYARPESALEFKHILVYADTFNDIISYNFNSLKNKNDDSYNKIKTNVNSVSLNFNNIIRYFVDLYNDNIDLEWAASFDPDSVLKNFYKTNKESIDVLISQYINTINVFTHVFCHNKKMINKYTYLMNQVVDYVNENQYKLEKIDKGEKVKNKYSVMTNIAFVYQFVQSYGKFIKDIKEVNDLVAEKLKEGIDQNSEEFNKWHKENCLEKEQKAVKPVIESFLHLILGCNILYGFKEYKDYFTSKNDNKALIHDVFQYLFNEYILESLAFRKCPSDKSYADFIKESSKSVAFSSIDYSFQRDVNTNEARLETLVYVFNYATDVFKKLIQDTCDPKEVTNTEKKDTKKKKVNNNINYKKIYKEKAKEKKKNLANFNVAYNEYKNIIENVIDTGFEIKTNEDKYCVHVLPIRDTKVLIRVERYNKNIDRDNIKQFIENALVDKNNKNFNIKDAYKHSKIIPEDVFIGFNTKHYYNQYSDGSLANKVKNLNLSAIQDPDSRYCWMINLVLFNCFTRIFEKSVNIIKGTGVDFKNKTIAIKDNYKFDIKYFEYQRYSKYNGNLNFYKDKTWEIFSFELSYDIVNLKKK